VIRQAHTYLVGAMGGATLIAIAIAVFVLLVSAQVFRDWPIAALGDGGGESAAVSAGRPAPGAASGGVASPAAADRSAATTAMGRVRGAAADSSGSVAGRDGVVVSGGGQEAAAPIGSTGAGTGEGGSGAGGSPRADAPSPGPAAAGGGGSSASGGGGGGGGDGGGAESGGGSTGGAGGSAPSTSGQVTETVNNTVSGVDETVLGGTLDNTGVTTVTEGAVDGVAGPESTVGKVVDEAVGAVGGLLGGKR